MSTLQRRIKIMTDLIAQLRELDQLRERVRKARLTAEDTDDKRDENLTVTIETYMATFEGHTPEQAKAKAMGRLDQVRNAFHIVRDPPPDKQ
jgi:hypothetical protein